MKPSIKIVADCREDFESIIADKKYNDHTSKKSIEDILKAVKKLGYECDFFGGVQSLIKACYANKRFENVLFLNFSDGLTQKSRRIQSAVLLELLDANYSGSGPFSIAIANDKYFTKKILYRELEMNNPNDIFIPTWKFANDSPSIREDIKNLDFPIIVKPNSEGSSTGITQQNICYDLESTLNIIKKLFSENMDILIEKYISGYEVTNFIIGNRNGVYLNEVIQISYEGMEYFDHFIFGVEEKSDRKRRYLVLEENDARIPVQQIKKQSLLVMKALGLKDVARCDYRITSNGDVYFLEVNPLPVISITSEIGAICAYRDMPFMNVINYLIDLNT
jgi:D-alanine-D-alanine ligase